MGSLLVKKTLISFIGFIIPNKWLCYAIPDMLLQ